MGSSVDSTWVRKNISEFEDRSKETSQTEMQIEKKNDKRKKEQNVEEL